MVYALSSITIPPALYLTLLFTAPTAGANPRTPAAARRSSCALRVVTTTAVPISTTFGTAGTTPPPEDSSARIRLGSTVG